MHKDQKSIQDKNCNDSSVLLATWSSEHLTPVLYNKCSVTAMLLGTPWSRFKTLYFV